MRLQQSRFRLWDLYPLTAVALVGVCLVLVCSGTLGGWLGLSLFILHLPVRVLVPLMQHNHAHRPTFGWRGPDAVLAFLLGVLTLMPATGWYLQHVVGHHGQVLTPEKDPTHWLRFGNHPHALWNRVRFALFGQALEEWDCLAILARLPQRVARRLRFQLLVDVVATAGLALTMSVVCGNLAALFVVGGGLICRFAVFFFAYEQHRGVPLTDVMGSSTTVYRPNPLTLNVGHHLAHHVSPALHWTELPALTQRLWPDIHPMCKREQSAVLEVDEGMTAEVISR